MILKPYRLETLAAAIDQALGGRAERTPSAKATAEPRRIGLPAELRDGRGDRIRTCDPLLPKQMRYQAALLPDIAKALAGKPPRRQ